MYSKLLLLFGIIFFSLELSSKPISAGEAKTLANNFLTNNYELYNLGLEANFEFKSIYQHEINNQAVYYIVNFKQGWVIISADDRVMPIIGFNYSGEILLENQSPEWNLWMSTKAQEINHVKTESLSSAEEIDEAWKNLRDGISASKTNGTGGPLLLSTWDQDSKYNALCPEESFGPGGHVYAGCVATSMAQIMYYYKYPFQGVGNHGFYDYNYGYLSVDFGSSYYDWNQMVNSLTTNYNNEVAEILYHCGVSVDMQYSATGSGAYTYDCVNAFKNYFNYDNGVNIDYKSSNTDQQWKNKIISSIDAGIPLLYFGWPLTGGSGHAFNVDGYQGSDYFHFNWGWSGSYDGYYYLTSLNPGSSDFSDGQGALFGIKPKTSYYPYSCQNTTTINSIEGSIFDGSGPNDYNNNSNCQWIIQPTINVENIELKFDHFQLDSSDYLIIYDGNTIASSILGVFTGDQIPTTIYSTSNSMLISFVSDGLGTGEGFHGNYKANLPVYCNGIKYLTDSSGVFTDGSSSNEYNNSSLCKWSVNPPGNAPIIINFNYLSTEPGADFVKIYDPTQSPSLLLGMFSGNTIPQPIISQSGEALVIFNTNESNNDAGWEISYYTGNVGLDETTEGNFVKIYPIPASNIIEIEAIEAMDYKLIDNTGKILLKGKIEHGKNMVNISTVQPGTHIMQLVGKQFSINRKIQILR